MRDRPWLDLVHPDDADRQAEALPPLVEDARILALVAFSQSGIAVRNAVPASTPHVMANGAQLRPLLFNLLHNALQALAQQRSAMGPPAVTVSASVREGFVEVEVADNGPGLAPEIAAMIFEPFVTTKPSGMGIGLSRADPLWRRMVEPSALNRMPVAGRSSASPCRSPAPKSERTKQIFRRRRMPDGTPAELTAQRAAHFAHGAAVHVVDDDEGVRLAFGLVLHDAGLTAVLHASAEAFLDALPRASEPVACVLTDLRMAGMDGIGLLRRLRATGFEQPVILVTGRGDVPAAVRAMKDGAADFIEKPCTATRLLHAIAVALGSPKREPAHESDHKVRDAARARIATLSPREHQVLDLLAAGHPNKEVARMLSLSPRTVEIHRARMMARLGVHSFAAAVRLAVEADAPFADHASVLVQPEQATRLRTG